MRGGAAPIVATALQLDLFAQYNDTSGKSSVPGTVPVTPSEATKRPRAAAGAGAVTTFDAAAFERKSAA